MRVRAAICAAVAAVVALGGAPVAYADVAGAAPLASARSGIENAVGTQVAVPVVRWPGGPTSLFLIRPESYGLTAHDIASTGLPSVPPPGPSGVLTSVYDDLALPADTVLTTLRSLALAKASATGSAEAAAAAAALPSFPLSIYVDTSNTSVGRGFANTAWTDTQEVFANELGITLGLVAYITNATAFPNTTMATSDVTNDCGLQRFARYEATAPNPADAVLVFSDGKIQPTGWSTTTYGLAIDGPVSRRWSRGESQDFCAPGAWASPAYLPSAHVSTDLGWVPNWKTERNAPSHWAAHEIAHLFGMDHGMARCVTVSSTHQDQSLEAASSDKDPSCTSNNLVAHYHFSFNPAYRAHYTWHANRWSQCKAVTWCPDASTPSAVRTLGGTPGNGSVTLTWQPPQFDGGSPVNDYCLFRSTKSDFYEGETGVTGGCGLGNVLTTTVSGLTNGQRYYFFVRAQNSNGSATYDRKGPRSNYFEIVPGSAPAAPVLNAIGAGNNRLDVSWSVPASNGYPITGYRVYRGPCSGCESLYTTTTATSLNDFNVANGTTYFYKVSAVNARGEGPMSNERSEYPRTSPGAPTLDAATPGNAQVTLQWTPPASDGGATISGYKVYRASSSTGIRTQLTSGGCGNTVLTTSCVDSTVVNGTTYWYDVRAVNAAGTGAASNVRSATPAAPSTSPDFSEDWTSGISGWSVAGSGASSDCAVGQSGCSLKLNPPQGSAGVQVSKALNVTMGNPTTVSFWFRGDKTAGDTDSNVQIQFNGGTNATLQITEPSSNNGVALYGTNSSGVFTTWPNAAAWYQAIVTINPVAHTATAQIKDAAGNAVGSQGSVNIATGATTITGLSFNAWFWGGTADIFNYDTVRVTGGTTSGGFSESWNSGIGSWSVAGSGGTSDCSIAQNGCSLKLNPPQGSTGVQVSKTLSHAMANPTTVSFWFRGDKTTGDTDSNVQVLFNGGANVTLQITEPSNNNGIALYGTSSSGSFYAWSANTWYQAVITINPTAHTAFVQIKDGNGSVLQTSSTVPIASAATTIIGLSFNAWFWGGTADVFHYDTVAVA